MCACMHAINCLCVSAGSGEGVCGVGSSLCCAVLCAVIGLGQGGGSLLVSCTAGCTVMCC